MMTMVMILRRILTMIMMVRNGVDCGLHPNFD